MTQQYRMLDMDGHEIAPWGDLHDKGGRVYADGVHYEFRDKPVAPLMPDGIYIQLREPGDLVSAVGPAYLKYGDVWYELTPGSGRSADSCNPDIEPMDDEKARALGYLRFEEAK